MKKKLVFLLSLLAMLTFVGCSTDDASDESADTSTEESVETSSSEGTSEEEVSETNENSELTFEPGTYTGTGTGYNGEMTLEVTFDETSITDIQVNETLETEHVGTPAYPILFEDMIAANGTGVDNVSGATFTTVGTRQAVNDAAEQANVSDIDTFKTNTVDHEASAAIEETFDVVIVGGGGAGMMAAVQAAQDGNTVAVLEKNAEVGGNTLVSGGQYQSVMPYLVWDPADPDARTGEYKGETYDKIKSDYGRIDTLKTILNWSEDDFDGTLDEENAFVAGEIDDLSQRGAHQEYLPVLQELKAEIQTYLDWAQPQLDAGVEETDLTLFSTTNLHIFQTYYGGLRPNADNTDWVYGDVDLVTQVVEGGQEIKPWLEEMGVQFVDETQTTLLGGLWQRQNQWIGSEIDGEFEEGRWATYFKPTLNELENLGEENIVYRRTTGESLIQDENGRVVGVEGTQYDGTPITLRAEKGVILSTGGYAANIDKVIETNDYWAEEDLTTSTGTTNRNAMQGDGISMAQEVGAAVTGTGWTQLMPISWIQYGNLAFGGGEDVIYLSPTTGERYVNESAERDVLAQAAFDNGVEYEDVQGVFIEIGNVESPIPGPYPYENEDVENRQYVRDVEGAAEVLQELGFDISVEQLEEAITEYDMYIMGENEDLEVPKTGYRNLIGNAEQDENGEWLPETYEIGEIRVRILAPSTHHTMGGLQVDTGRRVLDESGNPIPGLYAAGEVTGDIHGGNRLGGNAILEIIVSGRVAAETITADYENDGEAVESTEESSSEETSEEESESAEESQPAEESETTDESTSESDESNSEESNTEESTEESSSEESSEESTQE